MNRDVDAVFADLVGEHYPGSKQKRKAVAKPVPAADTDRWDAAPFWQELDGVPTEFFYVGAVAVSLNRRPNTIRRWLNDGTLPKARYRTAGVTIKGQRRLWTRAQVEGMRRIAQEEGLFDGAVVSRTEFAVRVKELFRVLKKESS